MNIDTQLEGTTVVSLSRRNLVGLLSQLDEGDSPAQIMRHTNAGLVIVYAEEDSVHYNSADREANARGYAGQSAPDQPFAERIEGPAQ